MWTLPSQLLDLAPTIAGFDAAHRASRLREMTELFCAWSGRLQPRQIAVFDDLMLGLAAGAGFEARVELSERLAPLMKAPANVIRDLAFDPNVGVAHPVLQRSPCLRDQDLMRAARELSQAHLFAIAHRVGLASAVAQALVERGNGAVLRSLCKNERVKFASKSLGLLIERALDDPELAETLKLRTDLWIEPVEMLLKVAERRIRFARAS